MIHSPRPSFVTGALALLACAATLPAQAGLSLDQALARHRQLLEADAGTRPGTTEALPPQPDGVLLVGGDALHRAPQLVASPLGTGGSGLRLTQTLADDPDGVRVRVGVLGSDEAARHWTLEGTELALRAGPGEAYASVQRRHWGPSWTGSLILDAAAPAVAAVGWRKTSTTAFETPWLAWLGPWNADFFIGGLAGHTQPAHPYLVGMRLQVQPLPSLQLGASRALQWGGRGRDQSFSSFWRGVLGRDNQGGTGDEPGNQLAGFDFRWHHGLGNGQQIALYGQVVGEDEAGYLPSKNMKLAGLEWSAQRGRADWRLFVEHANVVAGGELGVAYRHHIYRQGYTQDGLPLGHPAGGDTKLTSVGALLDMGSLSGELVVYSGRAEPTAQRLVAGNLQGVNAALAWRARSDQTLGLSLWSGRDGGGRDSAAQLWWQYAWR
jgi:hypothetical protein